jgi:dTDP-glucose 4,6-dehydratase
MVETVMDQYEIKQMNDYAMTKWANEMQIRNSVHQYSTDSVVVRLFNTYDPGEYYSPYRSVNCCSLYCAFNGLPWSELPCSRCSRCSRAGALCEND